MALNKDTFTATYRGEIEAMHGITMEVPHSVPNPAAWMESVWREDQAAQAAAEEKRQRQQKVLNDRIEQRQVQEKLLPTEQLQQLQQRLKELEGRKMPSGQELTEATGVIMTGQTSLMNAGLQLTEQARLQEEFITKNADQRREIESLMEENAKLHERVRGRHKNGLEMWNLQQEAAQQNIEAEQARNAELINQIQLQQNLIEKLRTERNEVMEFNEDLKSANRELKNSSKSFHHPRR